MTRPKPDVIKLWRCETCDKWSHAQRKPKHPRGGVNVPGFGEESERDER